MARLLVDRNGGVVVHLTRLPLRVSLRFTVNPPDLETDDKSESL